MKKTFISIFALAIFFTSSITLAARVASAYPSVNVVGKYNITDKVGAGQISPSTTPVVYSVSKGNGASAKDFYIYYNMTDNVKCHFQVSINDENVVSVTPTSVVSSDSRYNDTPYRMQCSVSYTDGHTIPIFNITISPR